MGECKCTLLDGIHENSMQQMNTDATAQNEVVVCCASLPPHTHTHTLPQARINPLSNCTGPEYEPKRAQIWANIESMSKKCKFRINLL